MRAAGPRSSVRFAIDAPEGWDAGEVWVDLRALSWHERLERESTGVYDEYILADGGMITGLVRRYDFEAMARYDLERCVVGYRVPLRGAEGGLEVAEGVGSPSGVIDALDPLLVEWVQARIDDVNLRSVEGRQALDEAKKN